MNDHTVSREWATRPDDQRFLSLGELRSAVESRRERSREIPTSIVEMECLPTPDGSIEIATDAGSFEPTNWSFGQLSRLAGAPPRYLRTLPAELACRNLDEGLRVAPRTANVFLAERRKGARQRLRAIVSPRYGRVWDSEIVREVEAWNDRNGNRWTIPGATYQGTDPKRATTLYASDRDVFLFLVDETRPIEVHGDRLSRGFYLWNSEVGSATCGLRFFLYRYVCDNRIIWGVQNQIEWKFKHTSGAPERFEMLREEIAPRVLEYVESSDRPTLEALSKAMRTRLGKDEDEIVEKLATRKLGSHSKSGARQIVADSKAEGGDWRTCYSIANAITARARSLPFTDARTKLERSSAPILEFARSTQN